MNVRSQPFERRALAGMVQDEAIHDLDRRRRMRENGRRRGQRLEQVGKLDRQHRLELRQRHQGELCFDDHTERAFRADQQLRHVEWCGRTQTKASRL